MWDDLVRQIDVEREQLNLLIETHRALVSKALMSVPTQIELSALGAMLHSFYTGIENIFRRVAVEVDGGLPQGEAWHRELLDAVARPAQKRPPVVSAALRSRLTSYLHFRHFFRHAYSFLLQWEKMAPLVAGCEDTLRQLEKELNVFMSSGSR